MDYVVRFVAGGLVVSLLPSSAMCCGPKVSRDCLAQPPSVSLVTLTLAFLKQGGDYVTVESRSMILGALALALYSVIVCQLLMRVRCSALAATGAAIAVWLVAAIGLKHMLLG